MACKNCEKHPVWEFTNQVKLCKSCFVDYFERKVFKTIRKYNLLPKSKLIKLKDDKSVNVNVLKSILEKKFEVEFSISPNFSSESLSQQAERIFEDILKGKFKDFGLSLRNPAKPLYFLSNREIGIYAKIKRIKGKLPRQDEKIQRLFRELMRKNPDLEHNIVNAFGQLGNS